MCSLTPKASIPYIVHGRKVLIVTKIKKKYKDMEYGIQSTNENSMSISHHEVARGFQTLYFIFIHY
jgi:hypothetical protein